MSEIASSTVTTLVDWATERFESSKLTYGHGCPSARDEAIWIVLSVTDLMSREFPDVVDFQLTNSQAVAVQTVVETRIQTRKPLAYLLNEAWFAGLSFYVDERTIVPRSHLGDLIQDGFGPWIETDRIHRILDLCSGSGCIAIALAEKFPSAEVIATDIDTSALEVAEINLARYRLTDRIRLVKSDLFESMKGQKFDLIVSNPPYVASEEFESMPLEYQYEPYIAFAGGEDGLAIIRKILQQAHEFLHEDGYLIMEAGETARVLDDAYPDIPFLWLTGRSGESVSLLLSAEQLELYQSQFEA